MGRLSRLGAGALVSAAAIVEFFRAVPVLLMMLLHLGVVRGQQRLRAVDCNAFYAVVTGLTLYNGSVFAELVRSGVHQLPRGQSEAGLSRGAAADGQVLRSIELPQALTAMLPALVGQLVVILKDSALGARSPTRSCSSRAATPARPTRHIIPAYVVVAAHLHRHQLRPHRGRRAGRAPDQPARPRSGGTITNAMPGAPGGSGAMASTGLAGDNVQNLDPRA